MKIFVAGATGAIGRPLISQLLAQGHEVVALTRSLEKAQTLAEQGVELAIRQSLRFAIADVFDADAVKAAITSVQPEVVIEQLTSLPKTYTRESMSAASALNTRIVEKEVPMCWQQRKRLACAVI
ncbi:SDR family oxidoreductase [Nostoc punctiforme]|uniref:SDR family oxidoreductase n=1 Tax=Nostoc punctiforme TaxID=272131 RepID=UPI000310A796|nr:SDR family NAD(P)-dependent oxidoreductase [Nostoc punctiforme]